jgi:hypothetical protein
MSTHPPLRRLIACILLPTYLGACVTWKTQEASPQQVLADEQPDKMRVTLADGSRVVLLEPVVSGDTLTGIGEARRTHQGYEPVGRLSIPLDDVADVAVRKGDFLKSVVLMLGIAVAVGVAAVFVLRCPEGERCWS